MIPSIETIIEDLLAGTIDKQQALSWLNQYAEGPLADLRDEFASRALQGILSGCVSYDRDLVVISAFELADAMLKHRGEPDA